MGDERLLTEQLAYYRTRAPEYDADVYEEEAALFDAVLPRIRPGADVLELACGTGIWTARLAERSRSLTAVDGAAEMLALARSRVPAAGFVQADLLSWRSPRRYDVVFFAAWLSHVPADRFAAFWDGLRDAVRPGGVVVFVDEHRAAAAKEDWIGVDVVRRRLADGSEHRIVKTFFEPAELAGRLAAVGWQADVDTLADRFVVGTARPQPVVPGW